MDINYSEYFKADESGSINPSREKIESLEKKLAKAQEERGKEGFTVENMTKKNALRSELSKIKEIEKGYRLAFITYMKEHESILDFMDAVQYFKENRTEIVKQNSQQDGKINIGVSRLNRL